MLLSPRAIHGVQELPQTFFLICSTSPCEYGPHCKWGQDASHELFTLIKFVSKVHIIKSPPPDETGGGPCLREIRRVAY
jgi:hypothetical protein